MAKYEWLTTEPNPKSPATGYNAGNTGWKLHAVQTENNSTFASIKYTKAVCGLLPKFGWGLDLFVEDKCSKCSAIIGAMGELGSL